MAKLKICGLTCKEDIEIVNEAKPDFAGFIIEVPGRRRSLTAERVKVLVKMCIRDSSKVARGGFEPSTPRV